MSVAPSRARSRSRAPSMRSSAPAPVVMEVPRSHAKSPLIIDVPARPRSRSVGRNGPLVEAPGLSGGRGMFKRLIVACDGTWNNSDNGVKNGGLAIPSNITRISRAIKAVSQDGIPQIVNYHQGLGTEGGPLSRFIGGATGKGLADDVREAYSFLANNYHPGDEIFLIGFSRGAFTARSIGGLIGQIGLLTKKGLNTLPEVYEDVTHRRNPNYVPKHADVPFPRKMSADDQRYAHELERRGLTRLDIPIKAIAVWDTVGSLGVPRISILQRAGLQMMQSKATSFYDTKLANCVENAFQALALDENRASFAPAVWEKPEGNRTTLRQVWFPGAHANVGGGYDDQQIANITLAWMMSQLEPFLDLRSEYLYEQDELNEKYYKKEEGRVRPWSFGRVYSELKGAFALGGSRVRTPGHYTAVDPFNGRSTDRPLRQTNEYIHPSVRVRYRLQGPGINDRGAYMCPALTEPYKLVVDYGPHTQKLDDPEIFWKIRRSEGHAVRELPEAPLWRLERELARRDQKAYDMVRRPPATGEKKKRRSQRPASADFGGANGMPPGSPMSPGGGSTRRRRRDTSTFTPRSTFPVDSARGDRSARRSSAMLQPESRRERDRDREAMSVRSRSRARSVDLEMDEERSAVFREDMPHRKEKDKPWWETRREGMRTG